MYGFLINFIWCNLHARNSTLVCLKSFVISLMYGGSFSYFGFRFAFFSTTVQDSYDTWFCANIQFCIMSLVYSSLHYMVVTVLYSL
jgi:hypothetical protein